MRRFGTQLGIGIGLTKYSSRAGGNGQFIPPAIKNSMVLWYDITRQGATNESMAENPILKDLSGNGHDIECFNFSWSGMSGVGGYKTDYTRYFKYSDRATTEATNAKIVVTSISEINLAFIETIHTDLGLIPAYKIKVSGIPDGTMLRYVYFLEESNSVKQFYDMRSDGEYELPANTYLYKYVGFLVPNFTGECNLTIEQLPLYPNALVSDGVDDYAYVEGLPILTDYTVIAKRKLLNLDVFGCLVSKKDANNNDNGSFFFENVSDTIQDTEHLQTNSFGANTIVPIHLDDISYQTKNSYNGITISSSNAVDVDKLTLFRRFTKSMQYRAASLYSLLLFDRTLTTAEIEWVKKNMIEGGTEI